MSQIKSIQPGLWSDPKTWGGVIPSASDNVIIDHEVELDVNSNIAGATINPDGCLNWSPDKSVTLESTKNVVVLGCREMIPANSKIIHGLRFTGINENNFVGGGEKVLDSDIGLWVMGNGMQTLKGAKKTAWTRVTGEIKAGDTTFQVQDATGWEVGDELAIAPTVKGVNDGGDLRTIFAIRGNVITVDKALTAHPIVNGIWTAEVLNQTRNVRIEGTSSGQSHTFTMSMMPSDISYVQYRYMGPRKNTGGDSTKEFVKGRYAMHFHHCMEGSRGMVVEGCVVRDSNSHQFVPHLSHGITFLRNIAYNCLEISFWYDKGDKTHDLVIKENVTGLIGYLPTAMSLEDPTTKTYGAGARFLGAGDGNKAIGNVSFGISGQAGIDGSGVEQWPFDFESKWDHKDNMVHNCSNTAFDSWQNTAMNHTINGLIAYNVTAAGRLGAYGNVYRLVNCIFYECALLVKAGSLTPLRLRIENSTFIRGGKGFSDYTGITAAIIQTGSPLDTIGEGQPPVLYRGLTFIDCPDAGKIYLAGGEKPHWADVVNCNITKPVVKTGEKMRVQDNGQAKEITPSGTKTIQPFAPGNWGDGDGALVEYFSDTNFKNKVAEIIQPQLNFTEWLNLGGPHHLCPGNNYSVKCTGQWIPQYTDTYTFSWAMDAGGSVALFIEGVAITKGFQAIAGKRYNFEIRFQSLGKIPAGFSWNAKCPSMSAWYNGYETVPQSQLYTPGTVTPPPNKPPVANAGIDQVITLPINSVVLNGSGSDADGVIVSYRWTGKGTIASPDKPSTAVTGLVEGDYVFTLTVTDDKGATGADTVTVTVLPAQPPPIDLPPTVTATATVQVFQYQTINLIGTANDPEGGAVTIEWRQDKGPAVTIQNKNQLVAFVDNAPIAPAGGYKFVMKAIDKGGNIVEKEVIF